MIQDIIKADEIIASQKINMLSGYKTYITAALGVIVTGLLAMGYIDQMTFNVIASILASLGLAFLRAGVSKVQ